MSCCSEIFIFVYPFIDKPGYGLLASLCLLIILVALWDQDFLPTFRSKLSALKKQLSWALNQEQEALWGPSAEAFWSDSNLSVRSCLPLCFTIRLRSDRDGQGPNLFRRLEQMDPGNAPQDWDGHIGRSRLRS